jgi:hypothetical protein
VKKENDETYKRFKELVNMTPSELPYISRYKAQKHSVNVQLFPMNAA